MAGGESRGGNSAVRGEGESDRHLGECRLRAANGTLGLNFLHSGTAWVWKGPGSLLINSLDMLLRNVWDLVRPGDFCFLYVLWVLLL